MFFYYIGIALGLYYLFLLVRFSLQTRESIKALIQEMVLIRRTIDSVERSIQKLEARQTKSDENVKTTVFKANEVMNLSYKTGQEMNTGLKTALSMTRVFHNDVVKMTLASLDKIFDAIKDSPLLEHKGGEAGMLREVGEMLRSTQWNDTDSERSSPPPPPLYNTETDELEEDVNQRLEKLSSQFMESAQGIYDDMKKSGITLVATNSGLEVRENNMKIKEFNMERELQNMSPEYRQVTETLYKNWNNPGMQLAWQQQRERAQVRNLNTNPTL